MSNGPRIMQVSHSVYLYSYKTMVPASKFCKIHTVPKAAFFPRTVVLLKAEVFCEKMKRAPWSNKFEKFCVKRCLTHFFIAALFSFYCAKMYCNYPKE